MNIGYIGFGDGINLDELDLIPNWQFNLNQGKECIGQNSAIKD